MSELINQPDPTTNRKVRWATTVATITAPSSTILGIIVTDAVPALAADPAGQGAVIALISSLATAGSTWATGYFVREEAAK